MYIRIFLSFVFIFLIQFLCKSQTTIINQNELNSYLKSVNKNTDAFNKKVSKTGKKYLRKYISSEKKLQRKLCKINPALADYLFSPVADPLFYHQKDLTNKKWTDAKNISFEYNSTLDTLYNSIGYINSNKDSLNLNDTSSLIESARKLKISKDNLNNSSAIQSYFRRRKSTMKETLTKYPSLKNGVLSYDKINYYYHETINKYKKEYINKIRSGDFIDKYFSKSKEFNNFMDINSRLSSLNKISSDWGKSIGKLQTNLQAKNLVNKTVENQGGLESVVSRVIMPMKESINKLKSSRSLTNAADVPDFAPNALKSKSVSEKLNFGLDYQVVKSNDFYPCQVSFCAQIGYPIFSRIISGCGLTYYLNLGKGWNNREFTPQDKGLRFFLNYKWNKSLYIETAYERKINRAAPSKELFSKRAIISDSFLSGLKFKKSIGKKHSLTCSFLYDFMYLQHFPITSPIVYRFGWEF